MSGADTARPGSADWFSAVEAAEVVDDVDVAAWDDVADLVVVGYGGAGVSAALEAVERGLEVLAVDRELGGGATAINGGVVYAGGGTAIQQEAGVADTPEQMYAYLAMEAQGVVADRTLRRFCDGSVEDFEWLRGHGVTFNSRYYAKKTSYPHSSYYLYHSDSSLAPAYAAVAKPAARGHRVHLAATSSAIGYGVGLYAPLKAAAERAGVRLMAKAEARRLVLDREGRVVGVEVLQIPPGTPEAIEHARLEAKGNRYLGMLPPAYPGASALASIGQGYLKRAARLAQTHRKVRRLRARKGVCLSAGGFIFNRPMVQHYAPQFAAGMPLGTPADDGAGIRLGQTAGGATARMGHVSAWRFINPPLAWSQGVLVDGWGERFVNEGLYGAAIGHVMCTERKGVGWLILDRRLYREAWAQVRTKDVLPFQKYPAMLAMWFGRRKATSLDALAAACGFDPATFRNTVAAYNRASEGRAPDPFGKDPHDVRGLGAGPYYALDMSITAKFAPLPTLTLGGLKVDEDTGQVVRADGSAIAGLYAAGRTAIGVCSHLYVSGLSVADCVFSGRRVGRDLARHRGETSKKVA
jgi:3-oxo-5alpha-steroid 4-dehydrogenase